MSRVDNKVPSVEEPNQHSIDVMVKTKYISEQSEPDKDRYVFIYHVTIVNTGSVAARLLARHWIITNGNQEVQEVRGDGVVGEQPLIAPGKNHSYTSGTVLETPVGTMHGSYQMVADDGTHFDASIPMFTLSVPQSLH